MIEVVGVVSEGIRGTTLLCAAALVIVAGVEPGCAAEPQLRPQWSVDPTGERYAPLPLNVDVKIFVRSEPEESYRVIGSIMSTCPVKQWVGGQHRPGRPVCLEGLRQGARKLGAQAIIEVKIKRNRPEWEPENPWYIMKATAVRLSP